MIKQLGCWYGICVLFMAGTAVARPAMAGPKKGVDHFYLGGSVGTAQINESDDIADFEFDTDGLGYKIFAGYNLGLGSGFDFAVEGSYVDFGRYTSSGAAYQDVECTAWDLFGVGKLDLGPIELFGKNRQLLVERSNRRSRGYCSRIRRQPGLRRRRTDQHGFICHPAGI